MDLFAETIEQVAPPPNGCSLSPTFLPQQMQQKEEDGLTHEMFKQIQRPAEHESDPGLPQSTQPQEEEEEEEAAKKRREAYEEACRKYEEESKESTKCALRSVRAHSHPDIKYKPNRKFPDANSWTDSDEEIQVPTKHYWLDICLGVWGKEDDADIISQVKATTQLFNFFTNGSYDAKGDSGCAAILHDFPHRPIVARSKVFSEGQCVSPFILQLEGVALGVKLAMQYDPFPFYLYCPSESVSYFVDQNWRRRDKCRCSGIWETVESRCKACSERLMFHGDHKDHEVAFELTEGIFSDISELKRRGLPWFSMRDWEKNEAAYHVASLLQDNDYKLKEIGGLKELWDIIYTEAFGIFFE
ncbi:hypothetical protein MKW98_014174 [Papaver atlanticum]|uniref:Uncharacterized protein n=1 Tax=Papaver atlanticum TaxID=357466 RepID=A0AAD4SIT0_9MAGN|nr:hypothetical protein MKW98_014174 [Papaver atlanticum]